MNAMKKLGIALAAMAFIGQANAAYQFVGSWYVGDGPAWTDQPTVYSGREAAALLFGGNYSDYAISTISNDPNFINFMAFVDGYGDSQFLYTAVSQDFKVDLGAPGYDWNGTPDYSAFVHDHSCFNRYGDMAETCGNGEPGLNFAFVNIQDNNIPEPGSLALLGLGLAGLGAMRRRLKVA